MQNIDTTQKRKLKTPIIWVYLITMRRCLKFLSCRKILSSGLSLYSVMCWRTRLASAKKRFVYAKINMVIAEKSKAGVLIENSIITSTTDNTREKQSTKDLNKKKTDKDSLLSFCFIMHLVF